ncbi:MAG: hypothetical protein K2I53_15765 [Lachnospiraceae bacterium]|nr:hypothetical protein [Lachnospiraceae bacterium]
MAENEQIVKEKEETAELSEDGKEIEAELEEVLESVPPEHRKIIERMMISSVQMRSISSPPEAVVMKKLTPEHISQFLEGASQEMQKNYAERFHKKVFTFLTMIVAMIFFVVVIVLLRDDTDVMEKVIYAVGGVCAGAFGGYGFARKRTDD